MIRDQRGHGVVKPGQLDLELPDAEADHGGGDTDRRPGIRLDRQQCRLLLGQLRGQKVPPRFDQRPPIRQWRVDRQREPGQEGRRRALQRPMRRSEGLGECLTAGCRGAIDLPHRPVAHRRQRVR